MDQWPFKCGRRPDIKIFRTHLRQKLGLAGDLCQADLGDRGESDVIYLPIALDKQFIKEMFVTTRVRQPSISAMGYR